MLKNPRKIFSDKALKKSLFFSFGVVVFMFMFWYVNKYIYNFRAAYPIANLLITPSSVPVNLSQDNNFVVTFNINGQKVTAAELYFDYDPTYVEHYKEYSTGTGFSEVKEPGTENYFDVPLIEEVTSPSAATKRLRLVVVSKFNDPANPNWTTNVTGSVKFRAKQAGTTSILVNKTVTVLAGVSSAGEATYFDLPSPDISASIVISGTGGTPTPTLPMGLTGTVTTTVTPTVTPIVTLVPTVTGNVTPQPTATNAPTQIPTATRVPTQIVTQTPTQMPTTTAFPTQVPTTGSGGYQDVTLNFRLRFQGMHDRQPADPAIRKLPVYIALLGDNRSAANNLGIGTVEFTADQGGVWTGQVTAKVDTTRKWNIFVKGPKHLRKRICVNTPQESIQGSYQCPTELSIGTSIYQINLKPGANTIDLSNILLLAGDIPVQNSVIDAVDIAYIRVNMGSQDQAAKARADLNYDGIIDAQDYSLILASLAFKYDEE